MKRFIALLLAALLGFAEPALAAISTPVTLGETGGGPATTLVLTTSTNDCPVGSLAVVLTAYGTIADTLSSVTDNSVGGPNGWTVIDNTTTTGVGLGIAYSNVTHDIAIGKTITATFGGSTTSLMTAACVASGIASSSPLDTHNHTSVGTTSPSTSVNTGTLAQPVEVIFGMTVVNGASLGTYTPGGSFAFVGGGGVGAGVAESYEIVSTTASVAWSASWTGTSTAYVSNVVSFKGASTGGATMGLTGVGQ